MSDLRARQPRGREVRSECGTRLDVSLAARDVRKTVTVLEARGGTVEKFIGGVVMAVFAIGLERWLDEQDSDEARHVIDEALEIAEAEEATALVDRARRALEQRS